jgi:single-strand DNA-binding protein
MLHKPDHCCLWKTAERALARSFEYAKGGESRYPAGRGVSNQGKGQAMSGSVNKVILVGNLGADPEIRRTNDGRPIANLRVATSENWRDKNTGERREKTDWHRVVIFNEGLCKIAEQYLKKGSKIYLEGQLQTRKWEDQEGKERYSTEVVLQGFNSVLTMLDTRSGGDRVSDNGGDFGRATPMEGPRAGGRPGGARPAGSLAEELDDEIPF